MDKERDEFDSDNRAREWLRHRDFDRESGEDVSRSLGTLLQLAYEIGHRDGRKGKSN